jgi:hypothetical protein
MAEGETSKRTGQQKTWSGALNNANILFWAALIIHLADWGLLKFTRTAFAFVWVMYGALIPLATFVFSNSDDSKDRAKVFGTSAIFTLLSIYGPYLKDQLIKLTSASSGTAIFLDGIQIFTAAWLFYIAFSPRTFELEGKTAFIAKFYPVLYVFVLLTVIMYNSYGFVLNPDMEVTPVQTGDVLSKLGESIGKLATDIYAGVSRTPAAIKKAASDSFNKSTGQEYYKGEVEKNAKDNIGVYIDNMKEGDPYYYDDQDIVMWATLKAKTYEGSANENNEIVVKPSCAADRSYDSR